MHHSPRSKHDARAFWVYMCVCTCAGVGGRYTDVVKTRSLGEQSHAGVGKCRHVIPSSRQWQGGVTCRTTGVGRGVGSVLWGVQEAWCACWGSEQIVKTHHLKRCNFFKTKANQTKQITHSFYLGV